MGKHCSKGFWEVIEKARLLGFTCTEKDGKVVIIPPEYVRAKLPPSLKQYIAHVGERALHPVRRYVKNQCGFRNFTA